MEGGALGSGLIHSALESDGPGGAVPSLRGRGGRSDGSESGARRRELENVAPYM